MDSGFLIRLPFFFLFIKVFYTVAAPEYLSHSCQNNTLFAPNSSFESNLQTLISSLSSTAKHSSNGFANATAGKNPPDQAYGLFLCRGDLDTATCSHCVATAKQVILKRCPNERVSTIWYDQCMLRYSNRSIFSAMERSPDWILYDIGSVTESTRFMQLLGEVLNDVASRASVGGSGKKVAVVETNFTSSQKLYALAQCTPDLTASDCVKCLQFGFANLPQGKQGLRVLTPSCNVRYQLYPFYNASALPALVQPPPAQAPLPTGPKGKSDEAIRIVIMVAVPLGECVLLLCLACRFSRRKETKRDFQGDPIELVGIITSTEPLQYDLATIRDVTDDFSPENKLGEGGFGEVFKGVLPNGLLIAVKKLRNWQLGVEEFKNEVALLANLQHRNIVQLLGFCSEGEEKLLVYEYVPNKSLDYTLFDPERSKQLNWSTRIEIARGIARGILYLHENCRHQIIHHDLKVSNILLDSEINSKIADFGNARILGVNQSRANTNRLIGTRGYMAPEYVLNGQFSVKSDVYSFGVLLLELISGKKNISLYQDDGSGGIAIHAWNNWRDKTPLELKDPAIGDAFSEDEFIRCLKIGLLCAQEDPKHRPTMRNIVHELDSHLVTLEMPERPAFFLNRTERLMEVPELTNRLVRPLSINEMFDHQGSAVVNGDSS